MPLGIDGGGDEQHPQRQLGQLRRRHLMPSSATVSVTNSTLSGNSASFGGGIYASSATVAVTNSTLSGNSAISGGGIYARSATVSVTNSTLSGNSANYGGGIYAPARRRWR